MYTLKTKNSSFPANGNDEFLVESGNVPDSGKIKSSLAPYS